MWKSVAFVSLMLSSAAAAAQAGPNVAVSPLGPNSTLLSVTAEGRSRRVPDLALFSAGVVTQGQTASAAMAENARRMERVTAALRRAGIAERDIQTSAISLQPRYYDPQREAMMRARTMGQPYMPADPAAQPEQPRIIGYEARNNVQVRVRRLVDMGRIIDTLIEQGANQVDGPSFTVDEPAAALDEARTEAITSGRQRAELYARAAGMRVGRILSITEAGGYYPVQDIVVTASAPAPVYAPPPPTPVMPGQVTLGVNVSMQFELVR